MFDLQFWFNMALGLGRLQHDLHGVQRWVRPNDEKPTNGKKLTEYSERRVQTVTQHCVEAEEICNFFIIVFGPYLARQGIILDTELLRQAVRVHDFGEGSRAHVGHDVILGDKRENHDKEEYEYFVRFLESSYPGLLGFHQQMIRAFLLQFCLNGNDLLPTEILVELRQQKRMEALFFAAIEKWGYLLYAMEQYFCFSSPIFLLDVFTRNTSRYDSLAADLPGFAEEIWTDEVRAWRLDFLSQHEQ